MADRITARVGQYIDIHDNENRNNRYSQIFLIPKYHSGQYLALSSQI